MATIYRCDYCKKDFKEGELKVLRLFSVNTFEHVYELCSKCVVRVRELIDNGLAPRAP